MRTRKDWKKAAHQTVKKHYFLLIMLCLAASLLGSEFSSSNPIQNLDQPTSETSSVLQESSTSASDVLTDILENRVEQGDETAQTVIDSLQKNIKDTDSLGHTEGILAKVVNTVSSGKVYVMLIKALQSITKSSSIATVLFILIYLAVTLAFSIFVVGIFRAVLRRLFLEARSYQKVPLSHIGYFRSVGRWARAALGIMLENIYLFFWTLTIIGGVIKHYSYIMTDYILAEDPDIKPNEAITLSRKMMNGHKWECFKLDVSFIGWYLVSIFTFGISDIFYFNAYETAVYTEYYADLRMKAKDASIASVEQLNDAYLYGTAEKDLLAQTYADTVEKAAYIQQNTVPLTKAQQFMSNTFGIWLGSVQEKNAYQKIENMRYQNQNDLDAEEGNCYPMRLNHLWKQKKKAVLNFQFLRSYTIWSLIMMFFIISFVGWIWEVSLYLVNTGGFVNRGYLFGPWIPIYGTGAMMIMILLSSMRKNPMLEAIGAVIVSGIIEFATSWAMEMMYGMRWWDYTGYFLNLDGRICAEGLFVFAVGGMIFIYFLGPTIDTILSKIPQKVIIPLALILCTLFAGDMVYSHFHPNTGEGVTGYQPSVSEIASFETEHLL